MAQIDEEEQISFKDPCDNKTSVTGCDRLRFAVKHITVTGQDDVACRAKLDLVFQFFSAQFWTLGPSHFSHSFMEDFVGCTPEALMVSFGADDLTGRAAQGGAPSQAATDGNEDGAG